MGGGGGTGRHFGALGKAIVFVNYLLVVSLGIDMIAIGDGMRGCIS